MEDTKIEEIKLSNEVRVMEKDNRYWTGVIESKKREIAELAKTEDVAKAHVEAQRKILTEVMNDIAEQSLKWAKEKASEMAIIEEKQKEIAKIDEQKAEVAKEKAEVEKIKGETEKLLAEARASELEAARKVAESEVLVREANEIKAKAAEINSATCDKINKFRIDVKKVITDLSEI